MKTFTSGAKAQSKVALSNARLNRLLERSEQQIPRGLKPARVDKNSFSARLKSCPDTRHSQTDFFSGLKASSTHSYMPAVKLPWIYPQAASRSALPHQLDSKAERPRPRSPRQCHCHSHLRQALCRRDCRSRRALGCRQDSRRQYGFGSRGDRPGCSFHCNW